MSSPTSRESKFKVVNIRGTGGSGKSHLVMKFMKKFGAHPLEGADGKVVAYRVSYKPGEPVYVIGRYKTVVGDDGIRTVTGGCDGIKTQDEIGIRVRLAARRGHVIFEGFLVSGIYSRYLALSQDLGGMVWAYMDTPLEKCIARISRRNRGKKFSTANTEAKLKGAARCAREASADGETVVWINHKHALRDLCRMLEA